MNAAGSCTRIALACCIFTGAFACRTTGEELTEDFLRRSTEERRVVIRQYPVEVQVDLFLEAMRRTHPSDSALRESLATNGAKIVPALINHLVSMDSDLAKMDLIGVFFNMQFNDYYDVASDAETMRVLDEQVARMREPLLKERCINKLQMIRSADFLRARPDD